jgi:5-methylcytosine-specific restriction protein A
MTNPPRLSMLKSRVGTVANRLAPGPKVAAPVYSSNEWRTLIASIIEARGRRCEDPKCKTPGRTGIRVFGDHIKELQDGGALIDPRNVMLRCGSCHTRKTIAERAKRMSTRW